MPIGAEFGEIAGLDGKVGEEVEHRATEAGVDEVRCDVAHRHHHESALVHPRVRDLERRDVGDEVAVHQQVEVEGSGTPVHDALALAGRFEPMEECEEFGGAERGLGQERGVEVRALFSGPPTGAVS